MVEEKIIVATGGASHLPYGKSGSIRCFGGDGGRCDVIESDKYAVA